MLRLLKIRVTSFRSIEDSGWIPISPPEDENDGSVAPVTSFIGTNESGKTNLLVALWKLKPAEHGELDLIADLPRAEYSELRGRAAEVKFIEAEFLVPPARAAAWSRHCGHPQEDLEQVVVSRYFDGHYSVVFPATEGERTTSTSAIRAELDSARTEIASLTPMKSETALTETLVETLDSVLASVDGWSAEATIADLRAAATVLSGVELGGAPKTSSIVPRYRQAAASIDACIAELGLPRPQDRDGMTELVVEELPHFVYYSTYGNLDSEIYLPHVIDNMQRTDLGTKDGAKARTLKVLFDFVGLSPQEILDLGREHAANAANPTKDEIEAVAKRKKERLVLLDSASTQLTLKFRDWWKQGDYRFDFKADGNHFRIMVSDDRRPEPIELESRSAGLQWFLSFYLVFLVESRGKHSNSFLLLDEPGISLHPVAQEDLSAFFRSLSGQNPLIYSTHSPFMVDPDHLDRVRAVYVDKEGHTAVSEDLRAREREVDQSRSVYPVYAALGLSTTRTMLLGCHPVLVEGPSDQHYLTAMKTILIARGLIQPARELLFFPAGGVRGIKAMIPLLLGKNEQLPIVLLDADQQGSGLKSNLSNGLYKEERERLISVGDFVDLEQAEVEDLIPGALLAEVVGRRFRGPEDTDFDEAYEAGKPIVPQVEVYARAHRLELEEGWKVEIAKRAKARLLRKDVDLGDVVDEVWEPLFKRIIQ